MLTLDLYVCAGGWFEMKDLPWGMRWTVSGIWSGRSSSTKKNTRSATEKFLRRKTLLISHHIILIFIECLTFFLQAIVLRVVPKKAAKSLVLLHLTRIWFAYRAVYHLISMNTRDICRGHHFEKSYLWLLLGEFEVFLQGKDHPSALRWTRWQSTLCSQQSPLQTFFIPRILWLSV